MNALTTIEAAPAQTLALELPASTTFTDWLAQGRTLATSKRYLDWFIGDWEKAGRDLFPDEAPAAIADLFPDERELRKIRRTVDAFPPHLRDGSLSFEHHTHVADLPTQEALPLLKRAHEANLSAKKFRHDAMDYKLATGRILPREDDAEDDEWLAGARVWNRTSMDGRHILAEAIAEAVADGFRDIEP